MKEHRNAVINDKIIKESQYANNQLVSRFIFPYATSIGVSAFKDCRSLTHICFGFDLKSIDFGAFDGCIALKDIDFMVKDENDVISISEDAFRNTNQEITFNIPLFGNKSLEEYAKRHRFNINKIF